MGLDQEIAIARKEIVADGYRQSRHIVLRRRLVLHFDSGRRVIGFSDIANDCCQPLRVIRAINFYVRSRPGADFPVRFQTPPLTELGR